VNDEARNTESASQSPDSYTQSFERAKRQLVIAATGIALGLAVSASIEKTTGGVLLILSWAVGLRALHRLGRAGSFVILAAVAAIESACTSHAVPDPKAAADEYARAAARGDANAIYAMMTTSSQQAYGPGDIKRLVSEQRAELAEQANGITARGTRTSATARLRYADGEEAELELAGDRFRVTAGGTLPGGARTTEQALDQLRRVLARRSYAGLMRVLSPATRTAIERDLRSLVEGLERPETLHIEVTGDGATVNVPQGHLVKLKREGGIWRVDDFD